VREDEWECVEARARVRRRNKSKGVRLYAHADKNKMQTIKLFVVCGGQAGLETSTTTSSRRMRRRGKWGWRSFQLALAPKV